MFVVQHRVDGLFWKGGSPGRFEMWTPDPTKARTFLTAQDAWLFAYAELSTHSSGDIAVVAIDAREPVNV